jgi:hypothetical protein
MIETLTTTLTTAAIPGEIGLMLADAGYWSETNATSPGPDRLIATLKDHKQRRAARDLGHTTGPPPPDATAVEEMEHLLRTPQGAAAYAQRSHLIKIRLRRPQAQPRNAWLPPPRPERRPQRVGVHPPRRQHAQAPPASRRARRRLTPTPAANHQQPCGQHAGHDTAHPKPAPTTPNQHYQRPTAAAINPSPTTSTQNSQTPSHRATFCDSLFTVGNASSGSVHGPVHNDGSDTHRPLHRPSPRSRWRTSVRAWRFVSFGHACPGRHLLGPLHGSGGGAADGGGADHDLRGLACAPTRRGIWSRIAIRDWAPAGNSRMRICRSLGPIADCARKGGVRGLRANGGNPAGSERLRQSRRRLS